MRRSLQSESTNLGPRAVRSAPGRVLAGVVSLVVLLAVGVAGAHGHGGGLDASRACTVCHVAHEPAAPSASAPAVTPVAVEARLESPVPDRPSRSTRAWTPHPSRAPPRHS